MWYQITDGHRVIEVNNGVAMLCDITATGCSVTALIAAYIAANPDDVMMATAAALAVFGY
jgi:hydroxyethylthiazole kinase